MYCMKGVTLRELGMVQCLYICTISTLPSQGYKVKWNGDEKINNIFLYSRTYSCEGIVKFLCTNVCRNLLPTPECNTHFYFCFHLFII